MELGTKSSYFSFNRKSDNYIQVGINGAENFKLNMKDADCQALDCMITLDLMNPMSRERPLTCQVVLHKMNIFAVLHCSLQRCISNIAQFLWGSYWKQNLQTYKILSSGTN